MFPKEPGFRSRFGTGRASWRSSWRFPTVAAPAIPDHLLLRRPAPTSPCSIPPGPETRNTRGELSAALREWRSRFAENARLREPLGERRENEYAPKEGAAYVGLARLGRLEHRPRTAA